MPAGSSYTITEGMLSDRMRNEYSSGDNMVVGYSFMVKNQFLHAVHAVGWIKKLVIEIDGKEVDPAKAYFVLRGQWFHLPKLYTISEVFWKLCEEAEIYIEQRGGINPGMHSVKCTFMMSMLEDTRILDTHNKWPKRIETVEKVMEA